MKFFSRKWLWIAMLAFCMASPVRAGINNPGSGSGSSGATGFAQENVGDDNLLPANFINVLKVGTMSFATASDAALLDDDGYLTSTPTGNVSIAFAPSGSLWPGVQYKLRWDAGVQFSSLVFNFIAASGSCTAVNATFTGCTGITTTVTTTGGAGSLTFTLADTQFSMFFTGGHSASHTSGALSLYRVSDETDFLAGEYFTPEYKTVLRGLNLKTIRPMGWVQNGGFNGETTWNYRVKPTTLTWDSFRYPPGPRAPSAITGTDTYVGAAAPDTPGSWTNGETYTAIWTNANTVTAPTLNIASRGAKTILGPAGLALSAGDIAAGSIGTVVYDGILDKLLYAPGGIQASIPIEAQAQLANRINANLWTSIPPWATDDYVTNWATTACSNLNSSLYLYPEYSNEVWNFGFPQTHWSLLRGDALGWSVANGQDVYGWYGLRVRQIMGNLIPTPCAGHLVRRVMAYQIGGNTTQITNRFKGVQLTPTVGNSLYCTYTGGTFSGTCTGGADYSTKPNRPIDVTEVLAGAPYADGENLCEGPDFQCTPTSANAPFYQALVTNWESGGSGLATAISSIDNDIRQGTTLSQTVTCSGTTFTTPLAHSFVANTTSVIFQVTGGTNYSGLVTDAVYLVTSTPLTTTFTIQPYVSGFPSGANVNCGSVGSGTVTVGTSNQQSIARDASTWWQFAESNAATFDGDRPAGMANLRVEWYEGNLEPIGLSSAQCTSLGITGTNCAGSIAAAIIGWKNDPKSSLTQQAYYNQFMGTDAAMPSTFGLMPHSKTPSNLILPGPCTGSNAYQILSGCLPNSAVYQTYNGIAAFHGAP